MTEVTVIGGGPAGMMAAVSAARLGADVCLIVKNKTLGRKLAITGKGRCNLTNHCDERSLLDHVTRNQKFLYSAFYGFNAEDTMRFFEQQGVPLKTERGGRVFPVSDKASDICKALERAIRTSGVKIIYATVRALQALDDHIEIHLDDRKIQTRKCVIATGGLSYPLTGSTGDGYAFAKSFGHTVTPLRPSLVGLRCRGRDCAEMSGLSLRNVTLSVFHGQNKIYEEFGEMLFTHTGISGPIVLSASAHMERDDATAVINLKPALSRETLDKRILRDFEENANKEIQNVLPLLLPHKMISPILRRAGIPAHTKVNTITKVQRHQLLETITAFSLSVIGKEDIEGAVITSGGVSVDEILPKTMQSKLCPRLYFAGEIIDVDAYTGGFNLQIAFSTGYAAGIGAAGGTL